jgi:hypothetical protein
MTKTPSATANPSNKIAMAPTAIFSNRVSRMFGFSLHGWENAMVVFLIIAGFFALLAGAATWAVVRLQRIELAESNRELERYKIEAGVKIEEAKKEGVEAGKTAGNALVRAAELEKEAANAKLETERLKATVAWRSIPPETGASLEEVLSAKPGAVNLRYTDGDPESLFLAIQISQVLAKSKWQVAPGALKIGNSLIFGFALPDGENADGKTLREAFTAAKIPFSTQLPQSGMMSGFNISEIPGAPMLMVGSRAPPQFP